MFCSNCGKRIDENNMFCTGCGNKLVANTHANQPQQQEQNVETKTTQKSTHRTSSTFRGCIILLVIGIIFLYVMALSTKNHSKINERTTIRHSSSEKYSNNESNEYKLACLNAGKRVSENHYTVSRFRDLINQIHDNTQISKTDITSITWAAWQKVAKDKYGIEVSLLDFMEGASTFTNGNGKIIRTEEDYKTALAMYITLLKP